MNNNPLIKAVEKGLVNPNQIEQSMVRGTLSDKTVAVRKVFNSGSSNSPSSVSYSGDNNFFKATHSDLADRLSLPVRSVGETEMRIAPMYMNMLEKPDALPLFIVTNDWMGALSPVVKEIKDEEVVLPFPACKFRLDYLEGKPIIIAHQNEDTLEITVNGAYAAQDEDVESITAFYKQHILFICIALEMELAGKSGDVNKDLGKSSVSHGGYGEEYKILPIAKKSKAGDHNINTGKTKQRLHVKRSHWRTVKGVRKRIKWFFAGNIELGIIVKDYAID